MSMKDVSTRMSALELCECEGVSRQAVVSLVEYEVAFPLAGASVEDWTFDVDSIHWLRKALRLRRDLELEWVAVAMVVDLLRTRERLERDNRQLQRRLSRLLQE
tara:strand:+ start:433 stop:744 length:312 start_codon:yes stop_codon:yes gene_type:complete